MKNKLLYLATAGIILFNCSAFFPAGKGQEEPEKNKIDSEIQKQYLTQQKDLYDRSL